MYQNFNRLGVSAAAFEIPHVSPISVKWWCQILEPGSLHHCGLPTTTSNDAPPTKAKPKSETTAKAKSLVKAQSKKKVNAPSKVTKAFENGSRQITLEFPGAGEIINFEV